MITSLVRTFLWLHLLGAVLVEVLAVIVRPIFITWSDDSLRADQVAAIAFLILGTIFLGMMLRKAAPILLEPRRAAVARMTPSPRIWRNALGAAGSFFCEACLTLWATPQRGRMDAQLIGWCLLPVTLCILIIGCCLLLVHFAKLHGQGV